MGELSNGLTGVPGTCKRNLTNPTLRNKDVLKSSFHYQEQSLWNVAGEWCGRKCEGTEEKAGEDESRPRSPNINTSKLVQLPGVE